jgi:hypothetical protein
VNKLGKVVDKPVHSMPEPCDKFVLPTAKVGIEVEFEQWSRNSPNEWWEQHPDEHSVRNGGTEFVTRGNGVCGQEIVEAVEEICTLAKKDRWSEGIPRAAIHIHLDVTDLDLDKNELTTLISNYLLVEHMFFGYAGDWRADTGFCVPFYKGQSDFSILGRLLHSKLNKEEFKRYAAAGSKYQALNVNPLVRFGTLEFRHLPTTFDTARIFEWINLILSLKKSAHDERFQEPLKLLSTLGPEQFARRIFGNLWPAVSPYLSVPAMWEAVDNATALMAMGGVFKTQSQGWDTPPAPSPILEYKAKNLNTKKVLSTKSAAI